MCAPMRFDFGVSSAACTKSYRPLQVAHEASDNLSGLFLCLYCIPAVTPGEPPWQCPLKNPQIIRVTRQHDPMVGKSLGNWE